MSREKTKNILNQVIADLSQFATVIHQAHWYMRGSDFLSKHPMMDEYMSEINDQLDEVAERLIVIGGAPYSTLSEFTANTKISDKAGSFEVPMAEHFQTLLDGYRYLQSLYQKGMDTAAEENDKVTEDMFIGFNRAIEKNIWMISAVLNKAPEFQ